MDQTLQLLLKYARAAWRRRWTGMIAAWLLCACGWVGVHFVPDEYESRARIYVDTDAVLTPLLKGLAVDVSPDQQVSILQQTLLSRPNLKTLISRTDLGLSVSSPAEEAELERKLERLIHVSPSPTQRNLFGLSYTNPNPRLARDVVQTLLDIFTEDATSNNRRDMQNAQDFLSRQVASYQDQLHALEQRLAYFRAKYAGVLPSDGNGRFEGVAGAREAVGNAEFAVQQAEQMQVMVKQEAARLFPKGLNVSPVRPSTLVPGAGGGAAMALAQAEQHLREMQAFYTNDYPGVIALKKQIEELKRAPGASAAASGMLGGGNDDMLYSQLTMKLLDSQLKVAELQHNLDLAKANLTRIQEVQREQPNLMVQYQNMVRDYAILQKNYDELVGRLQSAKLSQAADTQAEKVHLRVVDPPEIPIVPVAPNRPLLITGVLVMGVGAGGGIALLLALLDSSFASIEELHELGLPVLGALPTIGIRRHKAAIAAAEFAVVALLLIVAYGGLLARLGKIA